MIFLLLYNKAVEHETGFQDLVVDLDVLKLGEKLKEREVHILLEILYY